MHIIGGVSMAVPYSPHAKNPIKSWEELSAVENEFSPGDEWAFRGQNVLAFPATSLERHCRSLGLTGAKIQDLEVKLIRDFARRYQVYSSSSPPPKGHTLQWLALLQHYGTPTRLLDFTYSFFIAAYFAVEEADASSAIWSVNATHLAADAEQLVATTMPDGRDRIAKYLKARDGGPFRALFMDRSPLRFVYLANPISLNERLTIQQGLFLAPGDVTTTFEENLRAVPNSDKNVVQIIIDPSCRREVLRNLYRMGINAATLFPGLEGMARSLRTKSLIISELPAQGVEMLEQV